VLDPGFSGGRTPDVGGHAVETSRSRPVGFKLGNCSVGYLLHVAAFASEDLFPNCLRPALELLPRTVSALILLMAGGRSAEHQGTTHGFQVFLHLVGGIPSSVERRLTHQIGTRPYADQ